MKHKIEGLGTMLVLLGVILAVALSVPETKKITVKKRWYWFDKQLDDTDDVASEEYSGLGLYIDHGTGVHYIRTTFGSLTPRLDKNGNVVTEYQQIDND